MVDNSGKKFWNTYLPRPFNFENIMNNSVGSAIEKIKLQEQDNEVKLKERRECK